MKSATSGLTQVILEGFVWIFSSTALQSLLRLAIVAVLARLLTPEQFGIVGAGLVVIGVTEQGTWFGVDSALVQIPDLRPAHVQTGFAVTMLLGLLGTALIWLLAPLCADFFRMEELTPVLRLMSLACPLHALSVVASRLLQRELAYRRLAGVDVVSYAIGYGAIGIAAAYLGYGVWALVVAMLAQAVIRSSILLALQPHPLRVKINRVALRDLLWLGGGYSLASVMNYMARNADNAVVGRWLGAATLGVYSRAYALMNTSNSLLTSVVNEVLFPAIARVQHERERLARAYVRSMALNALLFVPATAAAIVMAPEIVAVLLGPQWGAAVAPFQVLAAGIAFRTGYKMSGILARGSGAVYRHAWRQAVYAAMVTGGALIALRWGVVGVAGSTLVALAVNYAFMAHLALRITGVSWRELAVAHLPATWVGTTVAVVVWIAAVVLRPLGLPAPVVLVIALAAAGPPILLLALSLPGRALGPHGVWFMRQLSMYRPRRIAERKAK